MIIYTDEVADDVMRFKHNSNHRHKAIRMTQPDFSEQDAFEEIIIITSMHNDYIHHTHPKYFAKQIAHCFRKTPRALQEIQKIYLIALGFTERPINVIPQLLAEGLEKRGFNKGIIIHTITHPLLPTQDKPFGLCLEIRGNGEIHGYYHGNLKAKLSTSLDAYEQQLTRLSRPNIKCHPNSVLFENELKEIIASIQTEIKYLDDSPSLNVDLVTSLEDLEKPYYIFTKNGPQATIKECVTFSLFLLNTAHYSNPSQFKLISHLKKIVSVDLSRRAEEIIEIIDDLISKQSNNIPTVFEALKQELYKKIDDRIMQFTTRLERYRDQRLAEGSHNRVVRFFAKRSATYFPCENKVAAAQKLLDIVQLKDRSYELQKQIREPLLSGRLGQLILNYGLTVDFIVSDAKFRIKKEQENEAILRQKTLEKTFLGSFNASFFTNGNSQSSSPTRSRINSTDSWMNDSFTKEHDLFSLLQKAITHLEENTPEDKYYLAQANIK